MYAFAVITEDSKQTMSVNVGGLDSEEQLEGRLFFFKLLLFKAFLSG